MMPSDTLVHLVWLCALHPAAQSSNPLRVDLLAGGGVVYLRVEKKSPHLSHAKTQVDLRENVFFLSAMLGSCLTPRVEFYF